MQVEHIDWTNLNKRGEDGTVPTGVDFEWTGDDSEYTFELSEMPDFAISEAWKVNGQALNIENLKAAQMYFWRINGGEVRSFATADAAPRWLHVDGLSNVRDIGVWSTQSGCRIRQGLIYRGSEMDTHHSITEEGVRVMREVMRIRTDLDVRGEAVGKVFESPIGKDVAFVHIPAKAYAEYMEEDQKAVCKAIFEVFADSANYPIYFHCWGGADRTGTIALLLEAVLGVSEEDLLMDYELTSLSIWGDRSRNSDLFKSLLAALDSYGDNTDSIHTKVRNYLLSCGITEEMLEKIKYNLLDK